MTIFRLSRSFLRMSAVGVALLMCAAYALGNPSAHQPLRTFSNPVIPGFASDPSIVRVGDDFYLVNSSFEYFPGIPVYHSRDLVNWTMIGHVMNDSGFGNLATTSSSGGIQAATIRYHAGIFYVVATSIVDHDWVSFVSTATDPKGPWSSPHVIQDAIGIDPSLFFDDDGRAWYTANGAKMTASLPSETGIWIQEFDTRTLELVGPRKFVWDGCCGGAFTEGPHIYKRHGVYYLLVAEGGTGFEHAVSIAASRDVTGPYVGDPRNPVLTNRHLGQKYPISGVGHADLVEIADGRWYAVALGWRTLDGEHGMLGRETFLVPVIWEPERESWREQYDHPVFSAGTGKMELHYPLPFADKQQLPRRPFIANFKSDILAPEWGYRRPPAHPILGRSGTPRSLRLSLLPASIDERTQYSFIGVRQRDFRFEASVKMTFNTEMPGEEAGLVVLQNDRTAYTATLSTGPRGPELGIHSILKGQKRLVASVNVKTTTLHLKAIGDYQAYRFEYSIDGIHWKDLGGALESKELSPNRLTGFNYTGANIGLYASSNGAESANHADFRDFRYVPLGNDRDEWFRCSNAGSACQSR